MKSCCCFVGGVLLQMTGKASDESDGKRQIFDAVTGGAALAKFQAMMEAQGVASETTLMLCSAHADYHTVLRKSQHQMELETLADGKYVDKRKILTHLFVYIFTNIFLPTIFGKIIANT